MRMTALAFAAAATLSLAAPAQATIVNYNFGGVGSGTMALDLTAGSYTMNALNLTLGTATFNAAGSTLSPSGGTSYLLGGNLNGQTVVFSNTDDYFFLFNAASLSQTASTLQYANAGTPGIFGGDLSITQVAAGVPEPGTWAMMLLGFGAIGVALRRRKAALPLAA